MSRIFLSYAHEDQPAAKRIVDALAREGLDAWWDHEIPPGRSWDEVIGARIGAADVVIVIWSQRSVGSNFVKEEAQLAYDAGKLLPVKIEEVEPPVGFRRVHAANLVGWRGDANQAQWRATLSEVRERLGGSPAPQRPPKASRKFPVAVIALGALIIIGAGAFFAYRLANAPELIAAASDLAAKNGTVDRVSEPSSQIVPAPVEASPQQQAKSAPPLLEHRVTANVRPANPSAESQAARQAELVAYDAAISAQNRAGYELFLREYPRGAHVDEIRRRLGTCRIVSETAPGPAAVHSVSAIASSTTTFRDAMIAADSDLLRQCRALGGNLLLHGYVHPPYSGFYCDHDVPNAGVSYDMERRHNVRFNCTARCEVPTTVATERETCD